MAEVFEIVGRAKDMSVQTSSFADFTCGEGQVFDVAEVFTDGRWSPFCLDADAETVVFVWLAETDLSKAPFYYMAQFEAASRVAVLSYAELIAASEGLRDPKLAFVFSIGRCGSTLTHHILNGHEEITSFSEPDVFMTLPLIGDAALGRALMRQMAASVETEVLAIKLRSQATAHLHVMTEMFPEAKAIFLYRDAIGWGHSFYDMGVKLGFDNALTPEMLEMIWVMMLNRPLDLTSECYADLRGSIVEGGALFGHLWQAMMEMAQVFIAGGGELQVLRYNELLADRAAGAAVLLAGCGVKGEVDLTAFEADSQAGTGIGQREAPARLSDAEVDALRAALVRHDVANDPEFRLVAQ